MKSIKHGRVYRESLLFVLTSFRVAVKGGGRKCTFGERTTTPIRRNEKERKPKQNKEHRLYERRV